MTAKIPITKVVIDDTDLRAVSETLSSGWLVQGPQVRKFEHDFARFVGAPHAVATTSCTTALHIALISAGVCRGDEVVVPAFTWIASANAVEYIGAIPRFCDIDLRTFNFDPGSLLSALTARTKAVMPVHLFGLAADMRTVEDELLRRNVPMIEDAACGFGTRLGGRHVGTYGRAACFSFHPRKAITTGEGGMIVTSDSSLADHCRILRDHGAKTPDFVRHQASAFLLPEFHEMGFNYRMTDIQASLGISQLAKGAEILARRRDRAERYLRRLGRLGWLRLPPDDLGHTFQSFVCLFAPEEPSAANVDALHARRNALMTALAADGIATRPGTHAVPLLDFYKNRYPEAARNTPNAALADKLSLTLPLYPTMEDEEQDRVIHALETWQP